MAMRRRRAQPLGCSTIAVLLVLLHAPSCACFQPRSSCVARRRIAPASPPCRARWPVALLEAEAATATTTAGTDAAALAAPPPPPPPPPPGADSGVLPSLLALNLVTLLWGSQHAVIKGLVDATGSPDVVNAARFSLAALIALPWAPSLWASADDGTDADADAAGATWAAGADLSLWMFAGYALQAIGLQFTTASRSAFLLYLNVKFVPVLAFLLYGRLVGARTWASAAVAVAGTCLLTYDGQPPNAGDAWSLAAAAASAVFILRLEAAGRNERLLGPAALNAATLTCTAALCGAWAAAEVALGGSALDGVAETLREQAVPLLYLSLVTTAFANWLQAYGQQRVSAPDAAIIYALDPVYGSGFSWLLLGEGIGPQGLAGAGLILLGVLLSRTAAEAEPVVAVASGAGEDSASGVAAEAEGPSASR